MGWPANGLSSLFSVANLAGQAIKALSLELTQTTGLNAIIFDNSGARLKFSNSGNSDFLSSDGTNITAAGPVNFSQTATFNSTMALASGQAFALNGRGTIFASAPTISSGFGGSPSISGGVTSLAFQINVGGGGVASTGVIGLPTTATGWIVLCNNMSSMSATVCVTRQTASATNSATIGNFSNAGAGGAWNANDLINCIAVGF
jgi:hypothetical protein